jgi:ArsR family transcriptional regulator, arsenate/arsenite/antimonite-responsive transcriptional repressor
MPVADCIDAHRYADSRRTEVPAAPATRNRTTDAHPTAVRCCAPLAAPVLSDAEVTATAELFRALADPNRVRIVHLLATADGPVCVCDLTEPLGIGQPTVSHHLRKLLAAGLVHRESRGTWAYYSLDPAAMQRLVRVADLTGDASTTVAATSTSNED